MVKDNSPHKEQLKKLGVENKDRQLVECWSRVMGYFRPVSHYNVGKKGEWDERISFKEPSTEVLNKQIKEK